MKTPLALRREPFLSGTKAFHHAPRTRNPCQLLAVRSSGACKPRSIVVAAAIEPFRKTSPVRGSNALVGVLKDTDGWRGGDICSGVGSGGAPRCTPRQGYFDTLLVLLDVFCGKLGLLWLRREAAHLRPR